MNNKNRTKLIASGITLCCCACAIGAFTFLDAVGTKAVPASITGEKELPIIILDAGHGGFDGGCVSAEGVPEKGINLSILLRLRDMLEISGYEVEVTRDSDISIHDKGIEGIAAQKSSDMDNRLALFSIEEAVIVVIVLWIGIDESLYLVAVLYLVCKSHGHLVIYVVAVAAAVLNAPKLVKTESPLSYRGLVACCCAALELILVSDIESVVDSELAVAVDISNGDRLLNENKILFVIGNSNKDLCFVSSERSHTDS